VVSASARYQLGLIPFANRCVIKGQHQCHRPLCLTHARSYAMMVICSMPQAEWTIIEPYSPPTMAISVHAIPFSTRKKEIMVHPLQAVDIPGVPRNPPEHSLELQTTRGTKCQIRFRRGCSHWGRDGPSITSADDVTRPAGYLPHTSTINTTNSISSAATEQRTAA
jgi:hypothetical protein